MQKQHISFRVDNLSPVRQCLDAMNITYATGTFSHFEHNNYNWIEWRDPDGIRLEFIENT